MKWTDEEIEVLKQYYRVKSHKDLSRMLPNKTYSAINHKAQRLNLCHFTDEERFWKHVNKKSIYECWNWTGVHTDGYGQIKINKKLVLSHRFSWGLHFGKIPKGLYILHHCDNRECVNPSHLFLGTQKDNIHDMILKNRQNDNRGENNGNHKLTSVQVKQIRHIKDRFSRKEIAKMFDVNEITIADIHKNKTWKHIE